MNIPAKDEVINKVGDLKVLPFVARKLLETISNDKVSISDLNDIIEKDQTITARVLKISNSALYGLRQEVTRDRKSTRLNSSHTDISRMPSSA